MRAELPELVKPLVQEYISQMEKELPGLMTALFLHGSIALGAFDPRFSDIDFVSVISRRCEDSDLERLAAVHRMLAKRYPRPELQGCYLQESDLGRIEDAVEAHPSYSDGRLDPNGHDDMNDVTWWLIKHCGVAVAGPEPDTLAFTVSWDRLIANMRHNLNTYWKQFTNKPARMVWLLGNYGIQWAVLGVLRQYYTFREHDITSKIDAGEYGLQHLPARWHRIIREALNIRSEVGGSLYPSRILRALEAVQFLKFVIHCCNTKFA
jgi:hypothetical protein